MPRGHFVDGVLLRFSLLHNKSSAVSKTRLMKCTILAGMMPRAKTRDAGNKNKAEVLLEYQTKIF
jgi:hypothetical protein